MAHVTALGKLARDVGADKARELVAAGKGESQNRQQKGRQFKQPVVTGRMEFKKQGDTFAPWEQRGPRKSRHLLGCFIGSNKARPMKNMKNATICFGFAPFSWDLIDFTRL